MSFIFILLGFVVGVAVTLLIGNSAGKRLNAPGIDADWYAHNDHLHNELKKMERQNRQLLIDVKDQKDKQAALVNENVGLSSQLTILQASIVNTPVDNKHHSLQSLEGCPFNYCDKNPVCEGKCRYA